MRSLRLLGFSVLLGMVSIGCGNGNSSGSGGGAGSGGQAGTAGSTGGGGNGGSVGLAGSGGAGIGGNGGSASSAGSGGGAGNPDSGGISGGGVADAASSSDGGTAGSDGSAIDGPLDVVDTAPDQISEARQDLPSESTSTDTMEAGSSSDSDALMCVGCGGNQTCCEGTCTLTTLDNANCGGCGHPCTVSGSTCTNGICGCHAPQSTSCGGDAGIATECVDLTSDSRNCGKCGTECPSTAPFCSNGSCVATCNTASDQTQCGTQCVTLGNDRNNCGTCGKTCTTSELCSGGVCTPVSGISTAGCADGTREVFVSRTTFPAIAACAGGWDGNGGMANYTGVFPAPLRTANPNCQKNGNSGPNPKGTGCSAIDLCASGWHICAGGEVIARVQGAFDGGSHSDACAADTWPAHSFFAAAIGSTGYYECAEPYGTLTGPSCTNASGQPACRANPGLTNDIFGCGAEGTPVSTCGDVDKSGDNLCGSLDNGWYCGTDGYRESVNAVHNPSPTGAASGGGVLCCANM
jgi:hypothetical protein